MMRRKTNPADHVLDGARWTVPCFVVPCLVFVVVLALCSGPRLRAQSMPYNGGGFSQMQAPDSGPPRGPGDIGNPAMEAKRMNALNAERQKSLVSDTLKLVKLTGELNAQINSSRPAKLTDAQLHMVAEIEKLAHGIREKMCTPVSAIPQIGGAMGPPIPPAPLR